MLVAGLRAIVKALLRSIRALKDAVLLTMFCVSVFGLVGYQLFHGTLRQKCVRVAGTLELLPDALFVDATMSEDRGMMGSNSTKKTLRHISDYDSNLCTEKENTFAGIDLATDDVKTILSTVNNHTEEMFAEDGGGQPCLRNSSFNITTFKTLLESFDQCFPTSGVELDLVDSIERSGENIDSNKTISWRVIMQSADIECVRSSDVINGNVSESSRWRYFIEFGAREVVRWRTRKYVVEYYLHHVRTYGPFIYYTEFGMDELVDRGLFMDWVEDNQLRMEPNSVVYFYSGSPDRPVLEPMYCTLTGRYASAE